MEHGRITTVDEMREHLGDAPDKGNLLLVTSCAAIGPGCTEERYLSNAESLQMEGFILHPRKATAIPVEIVTVDPEEADYVLAMIRGSVAPLAARQADAISLADQRAPYYSGLTEPVSLSGLGEMVEKED